MAEQATYRVGRLPVWVGVVLAGGFGVLAALWFSRGIWWAAPPGNLAGLFHFPSAYVGDSLLLPAAAGVMVAGVRLLPRARYERATALVAGLLAASGAVATQLLWLADDHPRGNWTLPAPHRFNVAGKWHAAFFVVSATVLAVLLTLLAGRLGAALRGPERERAENVLRGAGPSLLFVSLFAYAGLAIHDSLAPTLASGSSLVGVVTTAAFVFVVAALVLRRAFTLLVPHLVLGAIAALAAVVAVTTSWSDERTHIFGVSGSVLAAVAAALLTLVPGRDLEEIARYERYRPNVALVPVIGLVLVVLLPALWMRAAIGTDTVHWVPAGLWLGAYVLAIAGVPVLVIRADRLQWWRQAADVMAVLAMLGTIVLVALTIPRWREASDSAPFSSFFVAIIVSWLFFPVLRLRMHTKIRDEQAKADSSGSYELAGGAGLAANATVGMLIVTGVAGAVTLIGFTLAAGVDRKYLTDSGALPGVWIVLLCGVGLIALTAGLAAIRNSRLAPASRYLAPVVVLTWPVVLVAAGWHGVAPVTVIAAGGGFLLGLWSANTMVNNVAVLRDHQLDVPLWTATAAVAVSGFVSGFFVLTAALASEPMRVYTWFAGISTAAAILAIHAGLGVVAGNVVAIRGKGSTRHGLTHNLVQDGTLVALLYLVALVIPATTLLHLPPDLGYWARLIATFAIVGPFLTYFLGPYQWQLDTNLSHLRREIETRAEDKAVTSGVVEAERKLIRRNAVLFRAARGGLGGPPQHRFLRTLGAHIRNQNAIGSAMVVLSIVGFLVVLGGKTTAAFAYLRRDRLDPPQLTGTEATDP